MSPEVRDFFRTMPGRTVAAPNLARHAVTPNAGGWFDVKSARSGNVYRVVPVGGAAATCNCKAAEHSSAPCSHVRAVWEFAEQVLREESR